MLKEIGKDKNIPEHRIFSESAYSNPSSISLLICQSHFVSKWSDRHMTIWTRQGWHSPRICCQTYFQRVWSWNEAQKKALALVHWIATKKCQYIWYPSETSQAHQWLLLLFPWNLNCNVKNKFNNLNKFHYLQIIFKSRGVNNSHRSVWNSIYDLERFLLSKSC